MTRQGSEGTDVNLSKGKSDAFTDRMNVAIRKGGGVTNMAHRTGLSESVLRKWRSGASDPKRSDLVKVADAAGVSVEWLATGREDVPGITEDGATYTATPRVDLDQLEEVIAKTRRRFKERGLDLTPESEARVIRLIYEFYTREGKPMDEASLNNIIELAAFR